MCKKTVQYIAIFIALWLAIAFNVLIGMPNFQIFAITLIVFGFAAYIGVHFYYKKEFDIIKQSVVIYSPNGIEILKRVSKNRDVLSIVAAKNYCFKYNPVKVEYTGVSSGGISVGGFHTSGGDYSYKEFGANGKYELCARLPKRNETEESYVYVKEIKLSYTLVQEAKNDKFISSFLVGNSLILKHKLKDSFSKKIDDEIRREARARGDYETVSIQDSIRQRDEGLTYDECVKIRNWLSGQ